MKKGIEAKSAYRQRLNRRSKKGHRCFGRPLYQRRCQVPRRSFFSTGSTDGASVHTTGVMTSASRRRFLQHRLNRRSKKGHRCIGSPLYQRRCQVPRRSFFSTGSTDGASEQGIGALTSAEEKKANGCLCDRFNRRCIGVLHRFNRCSLSQFRS